MGEWVFRLDANANQTAPRVKLASARCAETACTLSVNDPRLFSVRSERPIAPRERVRVVLELSGSLESIDA